MFPEICPNTARAVLFRNFQLHVIALTCFGANRKVATMRVAGQILFK